MPGGDDEDPASSRADEKGLKQQQLDSEPNVEENKGGIYPTKDPTVARENIDTNASQIFKDDEDTEVAESEQYHENDDLIETDVSNELLCAGVKKLIVKSFKRKQRRSTVRKRSLKRPRLTEATSHDDFGDAVCKAYSRCSVPYFSEVVNSICKSKNRVELIRSTGFGYMLELDDCLVPRPFAQWIADKVIVEDEEIRIAKKRIPLTAQGVLHVRFLDFTEFGAIQIPPVMPRICIWKGSMVKNFSDMLIGENGMYRPSKIKDESETCYAQESFSWASTTKNSNLRSAIDRTVGKSLPEPVKDDIFNSF